MTTAASDFGPFRFSTDALPAQDRMATWREVFGRHVVKAEFESVADRPFSKTATLYRLPGLSLVFSESSSFYAERTRPLIGDGNDDLILNINVEGVAHAAQFGLDARFLAGEGMLLASADVGALHFPAHIRFIADVHAATGGGS
jgi:hypothetical protein